MARKYAGNTQDQKDFVKLFDSLTGKYGRWEVWKDMVWMMAIAISNSVDKRYFDSREGTYMSIVKKYSRNEMEVFVRLYGMLYTSIIDRTQRGNWGDFLGELFMNLNLGNELGGQFFTPYNVCHMMSRVTIEADLPQMKKEIEDKGYFSCYDSAVGAGAMLIAAAEVCTEQKINYPFQVMFAAQEIDSTTALMCYIQLSILGCAGYVVIGDTLSKPATGHVLFGENSERCWYTPMFFERTWHERREMEITRQRFRCMVDALNGNATSKEPASDTQETKEAPTPPEKLLPQLVDGEPINPPPEVSAPQERPRKRGKQIEGQLSLFEL